MKGLLHGTKFDSREFIYTRIERGVERVTVRTKCLAQEHNTMTSVRSLGQGLSLVPMTWSPVPEPLAHCVSTTRMPPCKSLRQTPGPVLQGWMMLSTVFTIKTNHFIHWIVIYPDHSMIHLSNNAEQM